MGGPVSVPDPEHLVHLQFRRFAGCPICNVHLRSVAVRYPEIQAAGITEVAVFHAPADELRKHVKELPFAVVADPARRLYVEFGVESAPRALLDPRVWPSVIRSLAVELPRALRGRAYAPKLKPTGGRLGLPGDFLIAPDGTVLAARIGAHADDQWSVDEVLNLARR
ncbi:peroxiredoxin-like family protein [Actinocorallia sp. A-T 12471]|uniref:peroxiredoxin-like family protein n=1 Tax=Actinocorallia sp. A-T 12471 TaxID=3089813 RepID=UPI0029CC5646|nr:peroxiredoxin-like family protein [Actinocorallia sp. A-T 12471]MDX6738647.1 peroxiredoxin-like family protein [Actinocorallia sp. A-T 12471]